MKINNTKKTVCVAMSGGVDSSIAAYLLKKKGYQVIGIFLKFWSSSSQNLKENKCCSIESVEDARRVANKLAIPLYTLNFEDIFKNKIVDDFILQYLKGKTPNPCIRCNLYIKFGKLLDVAKSYGADYLATGHYIKNIKSNNKYKLFRAKDKNKDQSYFLYNLTQDQLKYLLFPLGNYLKKEIKEMAQKQKLVNYQKKESQEICFVPNKFYGDFLKSIIKLNKGNIINASREIIGEHDGLAQYTIGQRKKISNFKKPGPYYVIKKDFKNNNLIVSRDANDSKLFKNKLTANKVNWISGKPPKIKEKIKAQIRYQHQPTDAKLQINNNQVIVNFSSPQKAITPGQSVVFYKNSQLLGGGVIIK